MLTWLSANIGTVLITLLLIAAVAAAVAKLLRDKKKGRSSCGCGCKNCAMRGACRQNQKALPPERKHSA